jgi:hypothetical protein
VPDARDIGDTLVARGIRLSVNGTVYAPRTRWKMFFNVLATVAEFEVDLLRMRTGQCSGLRTAAKRRALTGSDH